MRIIPVRPGARAFDHFGTFTLAQAQAMRADGFDGCFLYLELLTPALLQAVLGAGLWAAFVLEGLAKSTMPTRELGVSMAKRGSEVLRTCGVPNGPTVCADLESEGGVGKWSDWYAYGAGANTATIGGGDEPGIYIAEGTGLTRDDLSRLPARHYWRGAARIIDRNGVAVDEPESGWNAYQLLPIDITHPSGLRVDYDACTQDRKGRSIMAVAA